MQKLDPILSNRIEWLPINDFQPYPDSPRHHPPDQVKALANSISKNGWTRPIGIDEANTILFGHGCYQAAKHLHLEKVPALRLSGLSDARKRAIVIADNQLATKSSWIDSALKVHLQELINLDFEVELTGFSAAEIDLRLSIEPDAEREEEQCDVDHGAIPISKLGDLWLLGKHRLICGNALEAKAFEALLGTEKAQMVVTDAPYNVKIQGHARGRSKKQHREFAMASGEMSSAEFTGFLERAMHRAIQFSTNGSIHYYFMDWRHLPELFRAGIPSYSAFKNLLVWRKSNAGQGSFYRSQHELVAVFKAGTAPHINNFGLGSEGRYRTNVLDYPGGSSFDETRKEEMDMHPTVKPVPLIADLIKDCSSRNGLVLDLFGGSGTTILAAEATGRAARVIELDPLYVDVAVRRWQRKTGQKALHQATGQTFDEIAPSVPASA